MNDLANEITLIVVAYLAFTIAVGVLALVMLIWFFTRR